MKSGGLTHSSIQYHQSWYRLQANQGRGCQLPRVVTIVEPSGRDQLVGLPSAMRSHVTVKL